MNKANSIDALFGLPLEEFTDARNALAASLKKSGETEAAAEVKALQKPPVSAWAVNQLYWKHRDVFDRLLQAGARARNAQAASLKGQAGDSRGVLEERREILAQLSRLASGLLENAGHNATPDLMRRIATTLESLSVIGSQPGAPQLGRLTSDVDPPGFEALAALMSGSKLPVAAVPKGRQSDKEKMAAAKERLREAKKALSVAQTKAEKAGVALKAAAAEAKRTAAEKEKAEERLQKTVTAFEEADKRARARAAENEQALNTLREAERALEKAQDPEFPA